MPRAPKPCKKKGKGEAVAEDGPKMARMVDGLAQSCRAWGGKKQGGKLPSEAIQKLSQEVSELKMASWQGQGGSLPDLAILDEVLPGIFRALERSNGAKSRAKESETRENWGSGLLLAALVLDLSAFQGTRHQLCELTVASAMSFLWQQARFVLPSLLECKATEASATCSGLARALQSIHHILQARRSLPSGLGHKAAAMAAQCLTLASTHSASKTARSRLGDAAMDLLANLSGAPALQEAAMVEFARLAGVPSLLTSLQGPSFLALALRATAGKALEQPAKDRGTATARCGQLVAQLIQHALLERQDLGKLVAHLGRACGDLRWATAPLFASKLLQALSRVATAARSVDLDCYQREEATKLMAQMAQERLGPCLFGAFWTQKSSERGPKSMNIELLDQG